MSDDPPDDDPALGASPIDGHITMTKILLGVQGSVLGLFALVSPLSGAIGGVQDPELQALGPIGGAIVFGLMGIACFGSVAALSVAGAVGLHQERPWGWWCAANAYGLWLAGCGAPFGIYGLWALTRGPIRRHFGVA